MRSFLFPVLGLFLISGCGDDGGSSGGSGKVVQFSFDCNANTPICPGADHITNRTFGETIEMRCMWECATNTTDYVDIHPQKHSDPAYYLFTFHKVGDGCWEVHEVAKKKCLEDQFDNRLGKDW